MKNRNGRITFKGIMGDLMRAQITILGLLAILLTVVSASGAILDEKTVLQCIDKTNDRVLKLDYSNWTATIVTKGVASTFSLGPQIEGLENNFIAWVSIASSEPKAYLKFIGTEHGFKAKYVRADQMFPFSFHANSLSFLKDEETYDLPCEKSAKE